MLRTARNLYLCRAVPHHLILPLPASSCYHMLAHTRTAAHAAVPGQNALANARLPSARHTT